MIVNEHGRTHPEVGDHVIYMMPHGAPVAALVTAVWGEPDSPGAPAVNLAYVSVDPDCTDPCGRAIFRATSIVYLSQQSAPGNYWMFAEDATT